MKRLKTDMKYFLLFAMVTLVVIGEAYTVCVNIDPHYSQEIVQVGDVKWLCLKKGIETIGCETVDEYR